MNFITYLSFSLISSFFCLIDRKECLFRVQNIRNWVGPTNIQFGTSKFNQIKCHLLGYGSHHKSLRRALH